MAINVYADESGDLGFNFAAPFGEGGSSRFLTIVLLIIPSEISHLPKRIVKKIYSRTKHSTKHELKATELLEPDRIFFAEKVRKLIDEHPGIRIVAITAFKESVWSHIRSDPNKLYNWMIRRALLCEIKDQPVVAFIPDQRSIKVKSGNSLVDYLQTTLWFELKSKTRIQNCPCESHASLNLQFVDFIANMIWRKYEMAQNGPFHIIRDSIKLMELFTP